MAGLWGGPLPLGLRRRSLVIPPGGRHAYRPSDWQEAIVVVVEGQIEIEVEGGGPASRRFGPGDLLCFSGLGPGALRNPGPDSAVLIAVSKQPRSHA